MPSIQDPEFGVIRVHRSKLAKYVRLKINQRGELSASLPLRAPLKLVKQLIDQSRDELRGIVKEQKSKTSLFTHEMSIGKSHKLFIENTGVSVPQKAVVGQSILVQLPVETDISDTAAQEFIRNTVHEVLKKQARAYLPRRVRYLAEKFGFKISGVRFNNAKTRWGSCSSAGSINLNIALMQLPYELIDYVIIHELCHIEYLDHSPEFWKLVESMSPGYKAHRRDLKKYHPYI